MEDLKINQLTKHIIVKYICISNANTFNALKKIYSKVHLDAIHRLFLRCYKLGNFFNNEIFLNNSSLEAKKCKYP